MSVFAGDVQTPLAVKDPGTDYKLPSPGSLSYGGITSETALSSTNGVDTLLVAGNRDRQMNGNESTGIAQNRTHTVQGNQQKQVSGNKTENTSQLCADDDWESAPVDHRGDERSLYCATCYFA